MFGTYWNRSLISLVVSNHVDKWQECNCFHFRNFKECTNSLNPHKKWITKLSSAGLVYFHFGHEILSHLLGLSVQDPTTELIYDKVYENFLEEVDAIDNGIDATNEEPR